MTIADHQESFQIGRVVSRAVGVLSRNIALFLVIALVMMLPVLLYGLLLGRDVAALAADRTALAQHMGQFFGFSLLSFLVVVVSTYLLQAALVQGTVTDLNGEKPQLGAMLSTAFKVAVPIIIISVLALLGMMAGMLLLVVPGIILALNWCVVIPVRVVEQTGIGQTFGRSRALTRGSRWKILGLVLMYLAVIILIGIVISLVMGLSLRDPAARTSVPALIVSWLQNAVISMLGAVGASSVYYELREIKEGVAPSQLAAAFD